MARRKIRLVSHESPVADVPVESSESSLPKAGNKISLGSLVNVLNRNNYPVTVHYDGRSYVLSSGKGLNRVYEALIAKPLPENVKIRKL